MHLCTVATHAERYFPLLVESAERMGATLTVLGWGQKWTGYGLKLSLMVDFLSTLGEDEIVCFVDAFDTILLQPLSVMEKRFRASGSNMMIAMDGVAPNRLVRFFVKRIFRPVNGVAINSGTYIARAGHLRRLLKRLQSVDDFAAGNDQEMIARWCNAHPGWLDIDTRSDLFLTLYAGNAWTLGNKLDLERRDDLDFLDPTSPKEIVRVEWRPTGTTPCVVHAPCDGDINDILVRLGYTLPPSVLAYGTRQHMEYMGRAARSYLPLMKDVLILVVLATLLVMFAVYIVIRTAVSRLRPILRPILNPSHHQEVEWNHP